MSYNKILDKKAINTSKSYTGGIAIPTIAFSAIILTAFILVLALFTFGYLGTFISTILLVFVTYASYTPLHEAVHGNISGANKKYRWLNNVIGYMMAPIIGIPYTSHKVEHLTHHRCTNQEKDPDVHIKNWFKSPIDFVRCTVKVIWTQNTFVLNRNTIFEIAFSVLWRAIFVIFTGFYGFIVIFFGWFMGGMITVYLFSYKPHQPYENTQRYKNTSTMLYPKSLKMLQWSMFGQNFHTIHHLFPQVPFYHYQKLFSAVEAELRANETPVVSIVSGKPM